MAEYGKIERRIWNSKTFHRLSDDGKTFWMYLLTCPHSNMIGCFILKPGYALEDLQWSKEKYDNALSEVLSVELSNGQGKGLIEHDPEHNLILIKNHFEEGRNPITNTNQEKGAIKILSELPKSPLISILKDHIDALYKDHYKALSKALCNTVTVAVTVTVTEKVDEAEPENDSYAPPSKEEINESSLKKITADLDKITEELYQSKIFKEAPAFKNTMFKKKVNPRTILHTFIRCYLKREFKNKDGAWGYCSQIIKVEEGNYNEREHRKTDI